MVLGGYEVERFDRRHFTIIINQFKCWLGDRPEMGSLHFTG
jgi:hypothetical protein